jgi:hypothetical protein
MLLQLKIKVCLTGLSCNFSNLHRLLIYSQQFAQATYIFVANRCKSPQNAKIATYAGFADFDFRLQQRAQKKIS